MNSKQPYTRGGTAVWVLWLSATLVRIGFPPCLCPAGSLPRCSTQLECPRCGTAPCLRDLSTLYLVNQEYVLK
ncbi:hypothetical protein Y032_0069g390 [Ancylostoma ceylanicum]|uniref:Secreted protein n=1 Tax=Ancylostoma ceylanicum TaxID=53326 RepID=A0A016TYB1_9BILA|nr:hypothetical protein Y032_0069g390 [Ancylostoma ceylanicum]